MKDNPVFDNIVNNLKTPRSDLFRFCLSDNIPVRLNEVIDGTVDPITYAGRLTKTHTSILKSKLPDLLYKPKQYPSIIDQMYVYDEVIAGALMLRLSHLFSSNIGRLQSLYGMSRIYLLNTSDNKFAVSDSGGLTNFGIVAPQFIKSDPQSFQSTDAILLNRTIQYVSHIAQADWIMWDKKWQKLLSHPRHLKAFRRFLHASLSSFLMSEDDVNTCHHLTKDDLLVYMSEFIDLRQSSTAKQSDINDFVSRLCFHFDLEVQHPALTMLLEAPFHVVNLFFNEAQEDLQLFHQKLFERHQEMMM